MSKPRNKPHGSRPSASPSADDLDLERFFTNAEQQRLEFEQLVNAVEIPKRLLVIHGIGGTGKSTLLKVYRLFCQRRNIPIALIGGEDASSLVDVLTQWYNDLSDHGINLPDFRSELARYRKVQATVEGRAKTSTESQRSKVGKRVAQGALDAAAGAIIPVVGPMVSALAGAGVEASVDWLRGFLSQAELDLYLRPEQKLIDNFSNDINKVAAHQRIVLMLDTFEQLLSLHAWICAIARSLPDNVLLVIAGRAVPDWERSWPGWMRKAIVIEQLEMTYDELCLLVRRYHRFIRDSEPAADQVEAIAQFARGLPMVATTVVQLWIKYGVEDFYTVRHQVIADLVDRLFEGVPQDMLPAFEGAAVVRYFNVDMLEALLSIENANALYAELRRWPFIRLRREGLAVHDRMRDMINEALRMRVPSRFQELHERAVIYYEKLLQKSKTEQRTKVLLELLYHQFQLNEDTGTQLFCSICEQLVNAYLISNLGEVIGDANTYILNNDLSKLWRDYYTARLLQLESKTFEAESRYTAIATHNHVDTRLKAYALCDLGRILSKWERLGKEGGVAKAASVLEQSIATMPLDSHTVESFFGLARVYEYQGDWDKAISSLNTAKSLFDRMDSNYGVVHIYNSLKACHALRGEWKEMLATQENGLGVLSKLPENPYLKSRLLGHWAWAWAMAGRYNEAEKNIKESLQILDSIGNEKGRNNVFLSTPITLSDRVVEKIADLPVRFRNLGLSLGLQKKFGEAERYLSESVRVPQRRGSDYQEDVSTSLAMWGVVLVWQGLVKRARRTLTRSLSIKEEIKDILGIAENLNGLGLCYEVQGDLETAANLYERSLSWRTIGRRHVEAEALVALCRINYKRRKYMVVPSILVEARQIAQQYEYNDHLALLSLVEGHIAAEGSISDLRSGLDQALLCYQEALIYALRYNRFLLDELLWSKNAKPFESIISYWLRQGQQGAEMLIILRNWWQTGSNNIDYPRSDSISPVPQGVSLLEAESVARQLEPGDGSTQHTLVAQINAALATAG